MALPDFKKTEQDKSAVPQWAEYLSEEEFISYSVTYKTRTYLDSFDEYIYKCEKTGDIRYYVYDPVKHGASPHKKYPVTMWFHGASNSLMVKDCIMCCGAEQYASPDLQKIMGNSFIIVPLANETRTDEGDILNGWCEDYIEPVMGIYRDFVDKYSENISAKFIIGASSGGYFTWKLLETNADFFDGASPVASGYFPSYESLDNICSKGINLLIAHGKHDEMAVFDDCILPHIEKLSSCNNCLCFFPEWVYNGDGGVASVFYGFEMGQHCMINWIQHNLMFDNGEPADERLPYGFAGWIKNVSEEKLCLK